MPMMTHARPVVTHPTWCDRTSCAELHDTGGDSLMAIHSGPLAMIAGRPLRLRQVDVLGPTGTVRSRDREIVLGGPDDAYDNGGSPASVFGLLAAIIEDRTWERLADNRGAPFPTFTSFVEGAEPGGLGFSKAELVKILALRHPHEDAAPWSQRAEWLRGQAARLLTEDVPPAAANGEVGNGRSRVSGTHPTQAARDATAITARLKRDDPDLAQRVVSGEITANAAAREKGWRKPRIVLTSPASVAVRLRQHFTPDEVAELRTLLEDR